jgi:hypothetical protein
MPAIGQFAVAAPVDDDDQGGVQVQVQVNVNAPERR